MEDPYEPSVEHIMEINEEAIADVIIWSNFEEAIENSIPVSTD
jgi:hypothetical protein